jgi:hypothetical protein
MGGKKSKYFLELKSHSMQLKAVKQTLYIIMDEVRSMVIGLKGKWKQLTANNCLIALR